MTTMTPSLGSVLSRVRGATRRGTAPGSFGWLDKVALVVVVLLLLMVLVGPLLTPYDPYLVELGSALQPPSGSHWLGTDSSGRDVLSRLIQGARPTIISSLVAVTASAAIGVGVACLATLGGRWVDTLVARTCEIFLSLPMMVMAMGISVALGAGLQAAVTAMILAWWPSFTRLARSEMRVVMASPYVEAAQTMGASRTRLMMRHVLPNSLDSVVVQMTLEIGGATLLMAGLSFVGAGAQPPTTEWGAMIQTASGDLGIAWWTSVVPGVAIVVTAAAFAILGDALRARRTDERGPS